MGRFTPVLGLVLVLWGVLPGRTQSPPEPSEATHLIDSLQGPALYRAYCASCHGMDGKGDGPMAASLKTPPADLRRIAARSGGAFPMARVQRVITGEASLPAGHGTREMPLWGPVFSQIAWDQDLGRVRVNNLARYIEKMQTR